MYVFSNTSLNLLHIFLKVGNYTNVCVCFYSSLHENKFPFSLNASQLRFYTNEWKIAVGFLNVFYHLSPYIKINLEYI